MASPRGAGSLWNPQRAEEMNNSMWGGHRLPHMPLVVFRCFSGRFLCAQKNVPVYQCVCTIPAIERPSSLLASLSSMRTTAHSPQHDLLMLPESHTVQMTYFNLFRGVAGTKDALVLWPQPHCPNQLPSAPVEQLNNDATAQCATSPFTCFTVDTTVQLKIELCLFQVGLG